MIAVDDLAIAIKNSFENDTRDLEYEEAFDLAQHVLNFFGYSNRIIDNVLEPEDRDTFYILEDTGVLTTQREEITLYDGREWRIHYWLFRTDRVSELINYVKPAPVAAAPVDKDKDLYDNLPPEAWEKSEPDDEE